MNKELEKFQDTLEQKIRNHFRANNQLLVKVRETAPSQDSEVFKGKDDKVFRYEPYYIKLILKDYMLYLSNFSVSQNYKIYTQRALEGLEQATKDRMKIFYVGNLTELKVQRDTITQSSEIEIKVNIVSAIV